MCLRATGGVYEGFSVGIARRHRDLNASLSAMKEQDLGRIFSLKVAIS